MMLKQTIALMMSLFLGASVGFAENPVNIPDTPVGKQLVWLTEVLSGADIGDPTDRFDPEFLEQLRGAFPEPVAQTVIGVLRDVLGGEAPELLAIRGDEQHGPLTALVQATSGSRFLLQLAVDRESGKLIGLLLSADTSVPATGLNTWEAIGAEIESLPGRTAVLIARVTDPEKGTLEPIYQTDADQRLAIGSAFKLWVLGGLAELVHAGNAAWDEPLALNPKIRTMPLGELRTIANRDGLGEDAKFPLSQYADLMISISDNPATDHLIERVGRERIISFMSRVHGEPSMNRPFLTTGEFFKLKRGAPDEVLTAYAASERPEERAAVLASDKFRNAAISIPMALAWGQVGPIAIDTVEWFASPNDLAATMLELRRLEQLEGMGPLAHALRINDGINLSDEMWPSVAYKGGSEPGVINLTFLAEHRSGDLYFVTLGWNNTEAMLDDNRLIRLAISVFALIDEEFEIEQDAVTTPGAE